MVDRVSNDKRSEIMRAIKSKNTKPEIIVRKLVFSMGYRYRLHRKELPGTPDLVFPRQKKVIFVHGCFWHGHNCTKGKLPKSNVDYWATKIHQNKLRDIDAAKRLTSSGWGVLVIWQCELKNNNIAAIIKCFLRGK